MSVVSKTVGTYRLLFTSGSRTQALKWHSIGTGQEPVGEQETTA